MSFDSSNLDDDDDLSKTHLLAGGSQVFGGGSLNQSTGGNANGPTSSDRYQNLNSYLDANKNSTFGQDFVGKVQGETDKANQVQGDAANQFKANSDQTAVHYNDALTNSALADPNAFIGNQANVDQFKKQKDANYTGPNSLADTPDLYGQAYGQTRKAADTAEAAGTEGGRFALLGDYFGRGANPSRQQDYSQGEKSLDNLLVQGNAGTNQGIEQAKKNAQASAANFNQENTDLQNYASANKGATQDARQKTRTGLGINDSGYVQDNAYAPANTPTTNQPVGAIQKFLSQLDGEVEAGRKRYTTATSAGGLGLTEGDYGATRIQDPFNAGKVLNISGQNDYMGLDPYSSTYNPAEDASVLNRGNMASTDEAKRIRALEQLSDIGTPTISNIDQAGTRTGTGLTTTFNKGKFLGDALPKQQAYERDAYLAGLDAQNKYQQDAERFKNGEKPLYTNGISTPGGQLGNTVLDQKEYQNLFNQSLAALKQKYGVK